MLAAVAAAVLFGQASPLPPPNAPRIVHASGEGRISVAPDVAHVTVGVDAQDANLGRANADATARMRKVMVAIEKAAIPAKDVRTVRYSVEPVRDFQNATNRSVVAGYRVVNQVLVTLRDLRRIGEFLDQVVTAGANDLGALSLDKDDDSAERARALALAVADARARATVLAKAAGGTLGEALQVNEGARLGIVPYAMAARGSMDSGAPVATGELEISASVDVVFALR